MRPTLRLTLSLVLSATAVVSISTFWQSHMERARQLAELQRRAEVLVETLHDAQPARLKRAGARIVKGEAAPESGLVAGKHVYASPLEDGRVMVVEQDAGHVDRRLREVWKHNFFRLLLHALVICVVTLFVVRWTVADPAARLAAWMRQLRSGEVPSAPPPPGLYGPVADEAAWLARSLRQARAAAEEEAQLRNTGATVWTAERLKEHARSMLGGRTLFVVANREPYMHVRSGKKIEVITPASGLVTGVEPVLRACGGVWVGHGAGDADREAGERIDVPPDEPKYALRRVWLTKEEEQGYYYGFSNEGLWPLCHAAFARPVFKQQDWEHYQRANQKFADALLEEMRDAEEPCVLIQDYHFALLPALIKRKRPDARVALFWHIPWPNRENFAVCPMQRHILEGMLGADLLGFHTQQHCNNFMESADAALECRLDWERFSVQRGGRKTMVKPFPISVAPSQPSTSPPIAKPAEFLAVGVDRLDYTKGILERFAAVERLLEKNPEYVGRFSLVQIGAPSRVHIKRYRDLGLEIEAEADRINWRFKSGDYKPILLKAQHHSHAEIEPWYRAADVCMVTSLHDGMNLVAKEFVAARDDEGGALVLSRFTGAARELYDALIVNPYDAEQTAEALRYSLTMEPEERSRRMRSMRQQVLSNNVYLWGARLIEELAGVRLSEGDKKPANGTNIG